MRIRKNETNRVTRVNTVLAEARPAHGAWLFAMLLAAPFVAGAKGCDPGVVGDECPKGTAAAASAKCSGQHSMDAGTVVPDTSCGGLAGKSCPDGEYCDFPSSAQCGAADQTGTCASKPEVCDALFDPVCGCDGKTYGNACSAAEAGVSVARTGSCTTTNPPPPPPPPTGVCGGLQGATCKKGEYCKFPVGAQCGAADQTGICTLSPMACDLVYQPVCGCDGKTYGNDCAAAGAGVSVASTGPCPTTGMDAGTVTDAGTGNPGGSTCGGLIGKQCAAGEYCNFAGGTCGATDQTGACAVRPQICYTIAKPVCGCDGKTYGNDCDAAAAGVSVASDGACPPPTGGGKTCGGLQGLTCVKGEYCNFAPEARCGFADATGTCSVPPQACTQVYAPVCGCDGNTYSNSCFAAVASKSVASTGACGKTP